MPNKIAQRSNLDPLRGFASNIARGAADPPRQPKAAASFNKARSVRRARRKEQLRECAQDDSALKGEVPVFQIFEIARNAIFDVDVGAGFSTKTAHLSETSDSGFHKRADVIIGQ